MRLPQRIPKLWQLIALTSLAALAIGLWRALPAHYQLLNPSLLTPREYDATQRRLLLGFILVVVSFILAFLARLFASIGDD